MSLKFYGGRLLIALAAVLSIQGAALAQTGLRGEYYAWDSAASCPPDRADVFKPENLVGFGLDSSIDFGNPFTLPGTPAQNFGARWTGTLSVPTAGNYCFT